MKKSFAATASIAGIGIIITILLLFVLSPQLVSSLFAEEQIGASKPPVVMNEYARAMNKSIEDVSKAVTPSVVSISVTIESKNSQSKYHDDFKEFFKFFGDVPEDNTPQEGGGSGVIVTPNGYIITNNHVVENASDIKVITTEKKEYKAKLIGTDPLTDLAVIKIEGTGFPYIHFANMDDIKVGEIVLAIGNPLGLNSTVTMGIVSAVGRGGLSLLREKGGRYAVENFIQTDAAINPGNSGGGLFNLEGSLVGINSAIATRTGTYIGYGFAIPVEIVKAVVTDLIKNGKINRGYIGVSIASVDELLAKSVGLDKVKGVVVNEVFKESPAEKAGIEPGDILLDIDGKELATSNELQSYIVQKRAKDKVNLTIWRNGKKLSKNVKLEPRNDEEVASKDAEKGDENEPSTDKTINFEKLGFSVAPLTSQQKQDFKVSGGVFLINVQRGSVAMKRGLFPDGIIVKVDRETVNSIKDLKRLINLKNPGDAVMFQVKYKDNTRIVALEIP